MEGGTRVPRHRLENVKGGALMLFTALCISFPQSVQDLLPVLLRLISFPIPFKILQLNSAFVKWVTERLLFKAIANAPGCQETVMRWKKGSRTAQLLAKEWQLALYYYLWAKTLAQMLKSPPSSTMNQTPADHLAPLSDAVLCDRVLSAVEQSVPARPPTSQRTTSIVSGARVSASLFATTTPVALKSYLHHVLEQSEHETVTIYVPGLLTAPWTRHLVTLLRRVERQYGAQVVGYDVCVDAQRYAVDIHHLHVLAERPTTTRAASSSSSSLSPAASTKAILMLASLRGRPVHNRDEVFQFAKSRGWQMVELCVPTLPLDAVNPMEGANAQAHSAVTIAAAATPAFCSAPDLRITAFDDFGMYGGAVVHLCVHDRRLITRMLSECQVGLSDSVGAGTSPTPEKKAFGSSSNRSGDHRVKGAALCSLPSAALTATTDFATRSSEFLTHISFPWSSRLYHALKAEAASRLQAGARMQQSLATTGYVLTQTIPSLALAMRQNVMRLLPRGASRRTAPTMKGGEEGNVEDAAEAAVGAQRSNTDASIEQRTSLITHPLPPLDLLPPPAPQLHGAITSADKQKEPKVKEEDPQPLLPSSLATEGAIGMGGALTSWMSWLPRLDSTKAAVAAEAEAFVNTPAEWRIRLRWTALLLAAYSSGFSGPTLPLVQPSPNDVCVAAYVSLWSFVAQLPPWVEAVSAENEKSLQSQGVGSCGDGGCSCVEVASTALLVRVAKPACPRKVAQLLCHEAAVGARAVSERKWEECGAATSAATPSSRACNFQLEDGLVMPGCPNAVALVKELLYIPLAPAIDVRVRSLVLRALWEEVPHADDAAKTPRRTDGVPDKVARTLEMLYESHLSHASAVQKSRGEAKLGETGEPKYRPLRPRNGNLGVSKQDMERAQQAIFHNAQSMAEAAVVPPSFLTDAATLKMGVVHNVLSKL
ncbi:hypothetical protein ABL78_5701 [Leptomonas seymouri]|uniref:Uncharacterized protein n=1 Tax=Leptomonas seymouri TaxID=5684 RepID=A0A0N1PAS9_LEPSE|nr:hypothetical protein ABL78_5701 [Leptomonas seymouri]|eukprot:KPI85248.1 hypothetical protein ABL78_5701 [Leptomonas seymouri]